MNKARWSLINVMGLGLTALMAFGVGTLYYKFYRDIGGVVTSYIRSNLFLESENLAFVMSRQLEESLSADTLRTELPYRQKDHLAAIYHVPFIEDNLRDDNAFGSFVGKLADGKIALMTIRIKQEPMVEIHRLDESLLAVIGSGTHHTSYILNEQGDLVFTNDPAITPVNVKGRKLVQTFVKEPLSHGQMNIRSDGKDIFGAFHLIPHSNLYFFSEVPMRDAFWAFKDKFKEYGMLFSGLMVLFLFTLIAVMTLIKHRMVNQFMVTGTQAAANSSWVEVREIERAKAIFDKRKFIE